MVLKWGDMYKRTNALGFTVSEDVSCGPNKPVPVPSSSYDIREELFEIDEDISLEMAGKDFQPSSLYSAYAPSRQRSSSFTLNPPAVGRVEDSEIYFPSYDIECSGKIDCTEPAAETVLAAKWPVSPDSVERPKDDTAVRVQASQHVDYLSHEWSEEDVWTSWKHIVSKRGAYNNSSRLENASWRSWAQKRSNLRTVPPETVKWMKDHDVTWLYGPLTPGPRPFGEPLSLSRDGRRMSNADIVRHSMKSILKKRKLSEIMLRHSISSSLQLKPAVRAQFGQDTTPTSFPFESRTLICSNTTILSSRSITSPGSSEGWKKVQFHELVEQCIALADVGDEEHDYQYCSDSNHDVIVIQKPKKSATSKRLVALKHKSQAVVSKTIEKLPHAPLKDTEQWKDVAEEEITEGINSEDYAALSYEAASPDSKSLDHDSDREDDTYRQPPAWRQGRKDSVHIAKDRLSNFKIQHDEMSKETDAQRSQLERRDAGKEQEENLRVSARPTKEGNDAFFKFQPSPTRSKPDNYSFETPSYQRPRDDIFMMDPEMSDGESGGSVDMARSSSESSSSSDKSDSPSLALNSFQQTLVNLVMDEFWTLFNQQWNTYLPRGTASSPLSPDAPNTPLLAGTWPSSCDSGSSRSRQTSREAEKSNYFEIIQEIAPVSLDSKALADYESYRYSELPRLVHRSIEDAVRRDTRIKEGHLSGNLISIIHECEEKILQSYSEKSDRNDDMNSLGIASMNPIQCPTVVKDTAHQNSGIIDAQYVPIGNYLSLPRSSTLPSTPQSPSTVPTTPGEVSLSTSGYVSEITSSRTSPDPSRGWSDLSRYSLPGDVRGKTVSSICEADLYSFDELDEAIAWSQVY